MPEILHVTKGYDFYFEERYFLCFIGSIFLLGIVGQWVTQLNYNRLMKKANNMVSTDNTTLKQIKMKYENIKAVNGSVANPTIMVERYINKYKFLGIKLFGWSRLINVCELLCVVFAVVASAINYYYIYSIEKAILCLVVGMMAALMLGLYERIVRIEIKEKELICIINDFLENTFISKERRVKGEEIRKDMENKAEQERAERESIKREREEEIIREVLECYF